ncbi:hypothetical protein E4T50_17128 [Aureobasidium sp. EXF-12298]|nr:hypothetical protein E4T50_17128 [Aureobasidium sp. EXF-12298]KAI4749977.1 hypothetical protein E4T51_16649 [Aureobasidium sp. EXF-12344]KAI4767390.1 hypothetical protein E4T52_17422 [Aureobasidium sp. EXF-3400]
MTSFHSLPLELQSMIYDYALEEDHDFFADGVPALFKVCPNITKEIYSYRKTITTTNIDIKTPWPLENKDQQWCKITRFNQKQQIKGLVVRFRYLKPCEQQVWSPGLPGLIGSMRETLRDGRTAMRVMFYAIRLGIALDVETEVIDED